MSKQFICLFIGIIAVNFLYSQESKVILRDKVSKLPVTDACIQLQSVTGRQVSKVISDKQGEAAMKTVYPVIYTITCIGYKPVSDTLYTAGTDTLELMPDFYQLDNVVVTGQFRPQTIDKSIYRINVIDSRQIQLKAANNIGDLLKNDLSFQYHPEGVLGDFLRIRGLSGENIKILIDGIPVTGRVADRIDLGQLNLLNVDHIEIVEGPMSVLYGSNALAGAINIITMANTANQKSYSATANAYYENVGAYCFNASLTKKVGNNSFSVNGARNFYSGWSEFDTARVKIWKPKLQYLGGGWYQYNRNQLRLTYSSDFLNEELRDLGAVSIRGKAIDNYYFTRRWNNRANFSNRLGKDLVLNILAGHSYYSVKKIIYDNDLVDLAKTETDRNTTTFNQLTSRGSISNSPGKKFEFQTGYDYSYEEGKGEKINGIKDITEAAGFFNLIFNPFHVLSIQPGIRAIYNSKYNAPLVYAINLKYSPAGFTFRGSYAKGFKAPSLKQLYLNFIDSNHEIHGNEGLLPEIANNFSISADYKNQYGVHSVDLGVSLFYNSSTDAIQLAVDTLRAGWGSYFNVKNSKYRTKGIESKLTYRYMQQLTWQVGYSLIGRSRIDRTNIFEFSGDIASSLIYHNPKYNFELSAYYKYTDDYLDFTGNFNSNMQLNGVAQRQIDPYHSLDITLSKPVFKNRFTISGGIKNVFDVTLVNSSGTLNYHGGNSTSTAIGYGRTYFLKLNIQIDKY